MSAGAPVRAETSRARDGSRPGAMAGPPPPVSARTGAPARRCQACTVALSPGRSKLCRHCAARPDAHLYVRPGTSWTEAEDERLRELWRTGASGRAIAAEFNRSASAVISRAARIGCRARQVRTDWRSRWTEAEDELLRSRYNSIPARQREIYAALPGFTSAQIKLRAAELGVQRVRARRWTEAEDARLAEMTRDGLALATCAKYLRRSVGAVRDRRHTLRLPAVAPGEYTLSDVAGYLGVPEKSVRGWIADGLLRGRKGEDTVWRIAAPDVRRFLIDQRDLWSIRRAAKRWLVQVLTSCCEGRAE